MPFWLVGEICLWNTKVSAEGVYYPFRRYSAMGCWFTCDDIVTLWSFHFTYASYYPPYPFVRKDIRMRMNYR